MKKTNYLLLLTLPLSISAIVPVVVSCYKTPENIDKKSENEKNNTHNITNKNQNKQENTNNSTTNKVPKNKNKDNSNTTNKNDSNIKDEINNKPKKDIQSELMAKNENEYKNNSDLSKKNNLDLKNQNNSKTREDIKPDSTQKENQNIQNTPNQELNIKNTPSESFYNPNFNLIDNYKKRASINIKDISEFNLDDPNFITYNTWLKNKNNTKKQKNEHFDISKFNTFTLNYSYLRNNTLTLYISSKLSLKDLNNYKLQYKKENQNYLVDLVFYNDNKSNKMFVAQIPNINKNDKISLLNVQKNDITYQLKSNNYSLPLLDFFKLEDDVVIKSITDWKTWDETQNTHTFSLQFYNKNLNNLTNFPDQMQLVLLKKDKNISYVNFKYIKGNQYNAVVETDNFSKLIATAESFEISEVDKILGIQVKKNNEEWKWLENIPNIEIKNQDNEKEFLSLFKKGPKLTKISVENNNLVVNFQDYQDFANKEIELEIKSLDPFNPFSNLYKLKNTSQNSFIFENIDFPKDISKLIVTKIKINNELFEYDINDQETIFNNAKVGKEFQINKLNFYLDNKNRQILGSVAIDFHNDDLEIFQNKKLELTFKRLSPFVGETQYESIYNNLFLLEQKILIPFNKLQQFNLNGFYENIEYELQKIRIVDSFSLNEFVNETKFSKSLEKLNNKKLLYNFINNNQKDNNFIYKENTGYTKNDLINKKDEDSNIEYTLQNHYAIVNYKRENWYKYQATLFEDKINNKIKLKNEYLNTNLDKFNLIKNNKKVNTHFISPREIINNLSWNINKDFTEASITKDLSSFSNLDKHLDDAFFVLGFEFDPKQRQVIDIIEPEPFFRYNKTGYRINSSVKNMSKSFVYLTIPYKRILKEQTINNLGFEYLAIRNSKEDELNLKKLIDFRYRFNIKYNNTTKKLTFLINSKNKDIKIFDTLGDHYLSLNNSAFLGSSLFFVHWADLNEQLNPIEYKPIYNKEILSIGLEQLNFKDNYEHLKTTLEGSSKRVYFNNNEKNVLNARQRVFNFASRQMRGQGTWNVIGKVKPNDPNDFKFFITTNQHVWGEKEIREFSNNYFNLPIDLLEPEGGWNINKSDKRGLVFESRKWAKPTVGVKIITNFHNDKAFPTSYKDFKNNFGDINYNSTWNIYGEGQYGRNTHSLSSADLIVAIADFKDFYSIFEEKDNKVYYDGVAVDENDSNIYKTYKFFKTLKELKNLKPSKHNLHLSQLVNLNWSLASFPIGKQAANLDSLDAKRYREYIIGSMDERGIEGLLYPGAMSKMPTVPLSSKIFDLQSGASGSMAFDSEGNITGLVTESSYYRSNVMIVDTNANSFFGDGNITQNPGSFYERMRLLSYLYPEKYDSEQFNNLPNWETKTDKNI
ncbi:hypothetical protein N8G13_01460 [Mycoplasma zalophi]|uniref:hypothetical protein n=1 Tax=Mycoplasma zalophi TaxID=191287 RepID=UPI0021C7DFCD|nr:hypothetical protein [Mycoplasma zalophi]MCU4117125.1 hypothetical protein [Mycoplasma zalophi]